MESVESELKKTRRQLERDNDRLAMVKTRTQRRRVLRKVKYRLSLNHQVSTLLNDAIMNL